MTRPPLIDQLPPVLREPAPEAPGVLERFLSAFDSVQREVEREVERIPDLFAVVPSATLVADTRAGVPTLRLDSAAGLRPGDVLELAGDSVEFVILRALHVAWRAGVRVHPGEAATFAAGTPVAARVRLLEPVTVGADGATRLLRLEGPDGALAVGDSLALGDRRLEVESLVLEEPGELAPRIAGLEEPPRNAHRRDTPVHVIGRTLAETVLGAPAAPGDQRLTVRALEAFGAAPGDVLELDTGPRREFLRVAATGAAVPLDTALRFAHPVLAPVRRRERAPTTTPDPASFPHAVREGAELVLHAGVRPGETWLELDSLSGIRARDTLAIQDAERSETVVLSALVADEPPGVALEAGDVVEVGDVDPARIEYVTVAVAPGPAGVAPRRVSATLDAGLRHAHEAGVPLRVAGAATHTVPLTAGAAAGERRLWLSGAGAGDFLLLDGEIARVVAADAGAVTLAAPLRTDHDADEPVTVRPPANRRMTAVLAVSAARGRTEIVVAEQAGRTRRAVRLMTPLRFGHDAGTAVAVADRPGAGTTFLGFLAGWIGLKPRPDRGERWNRELLRLAGRIWPWRGTPRGVEAFLTASLRGEAERVRVLDAPDPFQLGLVSTVGADAVIGGMPPHYFAVEIDTEPRNSRLYSPVGLAEMAQAAHTVLRAERPAHTYYDLRVNAYTMQIGVDAQTEIGARVADTTLLWGAPQVLEGER